MAKAPRGVGCSEGPHPKIRTRLVIYNGSVPHRMRQNRWELIVWFALFADTCSGSTEELQAGYTITAHRMLSPYKTLRIIGRRILPIPRSSILFHDSHQALAVGGARLSLHQQYHRLFLQNPAKRSQSMLSLAKGNKP